MKEKPQNPKAFPANHEFDNGDFVSNQGMTLLDYFAAKAMQALIQYYGLEGSVYELSKRSYEVATEMLKEREKHI